MEIRDVNKGDEQVEFILCGRIPSKKNNRLTLPSGKTIPSQDYLRWQYEARWEVKMAWGKAPTTKPIVVSIESNCRNDVDNLAQSVLDMLEGVVYENDGQVREIRAQKFPKKRGEDYRTVVRVEVLD